MGPMAATPCVLPPRIPLRKSGRHALCAPARGAPRSSASRTAGAHLPVHGPNAAGIGPMPAVLAVVLVLVLALGAGRAPQAAAKSVKTIEPPWKKAAVNGCSRKRVAIQVRRESDIKKRLLFHPRQTVELVLFKSILLRQPLVLKGWSCTIFRSRTTKHPVALNFRGSSAPVVSVFESNNLLFMGVSLRLGVGSGSRPCRAETFIDGREDDDVVCPTLHIARSYGIQYTMASVYGRIDVFRSIFVRLDSLFVTGPRVYSKGENYEGFMTRGLIRVGECTAGAQMLKSNIVISNCEVRGAWELITLYRGTVGATVRNNFLHDYIFTAIRCGADISFVMDCYRNTIAHNYVYSRIGSKLTGDSAGIYFCTHWFNPGNVVTCNYVIGGDHCYYFDLSSSGIKVVGGVCHGNLDGFKINGGKFNHVSSVVVSSMVIGYASYVSCLFAYGSEAINCYEYTGNYWDAMRRKYYNKPLINHAFPWFRSICPPPTRVQGIPCNPPGAASSKETGKCSGIGYGNSVDIVLIDSPKADATNGHCGKRLPNVVEMNRFNPLNLTMSDAGFINWQRGDFGLVSTSKVHKSRRSFVSCPRREVGPRKVNINMYMHNFNIGRPSWYTRVVNFDFRMIIDPRIQKELRAKYGRK